MHWYNCYCFVWLLHRRQGNKKVRVYLIFLVQHCNQSHHLVNTVFSPCFLLAQAIRWCDCKIDKQQDSSTRAKCQQSNDDGNNNIENAGLAMNSANTEASSILQVSVSNEQKMGCECMHDTYTIGPYTPVPSPYYWEEGRKYHGKSCYINKCKKAIPKPCERTPLYVCTQFALNKGDGCGCVICHECFGKELVKADKRPSRRRGWPPI